MIRIFFFMNGNTAVFGDDRKQVPDLQESWMIKFLEWLALQPEMKGRKIEDFEVNLPSGKKARIFKVPDGYNWEILPD